MCIEVLLTRGISVSFGDMSLSGNTIRNLVKLKIIDKEPPSTPHTLFSGLDYTLPFSFSQVMSLKSGYIIKFVIVIQSKKYPF